MRQKLIQLSNINYQNASTCSGIRVDVTCREMQQEHIIQTSLALARIRINDQVPITGIKHQIFLNGSFFLFYFPHRVCVKTLPNFTKHYKLSSVDVSQCVVFSCKEFCARIQLFKHRCRAILGCQPWKIGDVNCDDETPSIRRTRVSPGDWQKSGVVGNPDTQKDPIAPKSPGRDKCRSIRSHNRPCHAR